MAPIPWESAHVAAVYEDMVAVLIKRLHPAAHRIDGSGGDGGRDVIVPTGNGQLIYELKSFSGRLTTGGRKSQIARSLSRAAGHDPAWWGLVVPIDPTPSESEWFEAITAEYEFECEWLGRTWLDSEMSIRPEIQRYFLSGLNDEMVDLLRQLRSEDFSPESSMEAIVRARQIRARLNETDPYFEYKLVLGAGDTAPVPRSILSVRIGDDRIDVVPRYATALIDCPVTGTLDLDFQRDESGIRERFLDAVSYGDRVELPPAVVRRATLDAPGGLGFDSEDVHIIMGAHEEELNPPLRMEMSIFGPDSETRLGSLEFIANRRRSGQHGARLWGADVTGLIDLAITVTPEDRRMNFNVSFSPKPVLPMAGLAATQWLELLRPPNQIRAAILDAEASREVGVMDIPAPIGEGDLSLVYRSFLEIQRRSGTTFVVPDDLDDEEIDMLVKTDSWTREQRREFEWNELTFRIVPGRLEEVLGRLSEPAALFTQADVSITFRGRTLELGTLARMFDRAQVGEVLPENEAGEPGIRMVPHESRKGREWLMPLGA